MSCQHQPAAFLFVNKDRTSRSLSRGDDNRHEIGKHIQQWRQGNKHQALRINAGPALKIARHGWSKNQSSARDGPSRRPGISGEAQRDPGAISLELKISTTNTIAGSCIDPFDCIPVDLNPEVQQILQYFLRYTIIASHTYRFKILPPQLRQHRHRFAFNLRVKRCLFDKRHMFSLLTVAAAWMKMVSGVQLARRNSP
jgi:hypothetical protein